MVHLLEFDLPGLLSFPKRGWEVESVLLQHGVKFVEAVAEEVDAVDDELVLLLVELVLLFVVEGQVALRLMVLIDSWVLRPERLFLVAIYPGLRRPVLLLIDLVLSHIHVLEDNLGRGALLDWLCHAVLLQILSIVLGSRVYDLVLDYVEVCGHRVRRYHVLISNSFDSICLVLSYTNI